MVGGGHDRPLGTGSGGRWARRGPTSEDEILDDSPPGRLARLPTCGR